MKKTTFAKIFIRSFFVLAVGNYERMQNLGFLFVIAPVLKKVYPDREQRIEAYQRHLEFFNVNPYFMTIPAGIAIAMEEEKLPAKSISDMKMTLSGPLAAVGDSLIWAALRPFAAFSVIALMLITGIVRVPDGIIEVTELFNGWTFAVMSLLFLLIFNGYIMFLRYYGLKHGYEKKTGVVALIKKISDTNLVENIRRVGHYLMGITMVVVFFRDLTITPRLLFIGVFPILFFLIRKGVSVVLLFYVVVILSIVIKYL